MPSLEELWPPGGARGRGERQGRVGWGPRARARLSPALPGRSPCPGAVARRDHALFGELKTYNRGVLPLNFQFSKEPMNVVDMASIMACASCDECGVLFETLSDLQNHIRSWCYRGSDRKRPRLESQSSDEENDNIAFINMANQIKEETEKRFKAHVQKYQADGFTLKQAKEEAEMVMLPGDRQIMYKKYLAFLQTLFTFHKSELHHSIVRAIKEELDKSGDTTTAIRNVLRKRKMEITDFVDTGEQSSREDSDNGGTDDNI